ncbi:unnamed protein product [Bursaphelenchus xylophilus]|uniref:(pine wood nematode) hypothetical protein n=1 Tax=Bursaphelenchus xylophilus TaxID=6326 RepID=A0A1I7S9A8_BURXY|nr:unnamed protein product [Bursaphelenchus xylophilus]CAG9100485.1 unnamed protein product [Bursaphelenchus xylophilus]
MAGVENAKTKKIYAPEVDKTRYRRYTVKEDMMMIKFFIKEYKAGNPAAQVRQSLRLWDLFVREKNWDRLSVAVESHFRKRILKKLFKFDIKAKDMFLIARQFELTLTDGQKKSLEERFNCKIKTNEAGVLLEAYDCKSGKPLHIRKVRLPQVEEPREPTVEPNPPRESRESSVSSRRRKKEASLDQSPAATNPKRPRLDDYDNAQTYAPPSEHGEEEPNQTTREMTPGSLAESFAAADENSDDEFPVPRYLPIRPAVAQRAQIDESSVYERVRRSLQHRLEAIFDGNLAPEMLDDMPLFQEAEGCTEMIQMLKQITMTIFNGSEEDVDNFDERFGALQIEPASPQMTSTPLNRDRTSMRHFLNDVTNDADATLRMTSPVHAHRLPEDFDQDEHRNIVNDDINRTAEPQEFMEKSPGPQESPENNQTVEMQEFEEYLEKNQELEPQEFEKNNSAIEPQQFQEQVIVGEPASNLGISHQPLQKTLPTTPIENRIPEVDSSSRTDVGLSRAHLSFPRPAEDQVLEFLRRMARKTK